MIILLLDKIIASKDSTPLALQLQSNSSKSGLPYSTINTLLLDAKQ